MTSFSTYIASGNVFLDSELSASKVASTIEAALPNAFRLDSVKVLVLTPSDLEAVVMGRPNGFGDEPSRYHSDTIFLMGIDAEEAMQVFSPRDGVDKVWPGPGVVYSQRLSAERTKSRLNRIMASPLYKSMTIRSWQTTRALLELMRGRSSRRRVVTSERRSRSVDVAK